MITTRWEGTNGFHFGRRMVFDGWGGHLYLILCHFPAGHLSHSTVSMVHWSMHVDEVAEYFL